MSDEVKLAYEKLQRAVSALKQGTEKASSDLEKDGVIQRFEFTFELAWKTLKIYLNELEGIVSRSPKETLIKSFQLQYIQEEEIYLNMLEDRNRSTHIYSEKESNRIYGNIKEKYVIVLLELLEVLSGKNN